MTFKLSDDDKKMLGSFVEGFARVAAGKRTMGDKQRSGQTPIVEDGMINPTTIIMLVGISYFASYYLFPSNKRVNEDEQGSNDMPNYEESEELPSEKANEFISNVVISKLADTLEQFEMIGSSLELIRELDGDQIFKKEVKNLVEDLTPYISKTGLVRGSLIAGKHIRNKRRKTRPT